MAKLYKEPKTLQALNQLDQELQDHYDSKLDDYLGLMISFNDDDDRYDCTPDDAIIFGRTGVDGDHFAFMTSDWTVEDLEDAPIVFIQPMDFDNEIKLVARNLKDFISLFIELKELYLLERFEIYKNENDFIKDIEENYKDELESRTDEYSFIAEKLHKYIELNKIENVFNYIKDLRK